MTEIVWNLIEWDFFTTYFGVFMFCFFGGYSAGKSIGFTRKIAHQSI